MESLEVGDVSLGLNRKMKEHEAKILLLLCKKSGEFILPEHLHSAKGIAGATGKRIDKIYGQLARMEAAGYLTSFKNPNDRRSTFYAPVPEKIKVAMELVGVIAKPPLIDCEVCGTNYSSLMKGCPTCARNEAAYLLQAKAEDPKRSKSGKVINTKTITHVPGVGRKKTGNEKDSSLEKYKISENRRKIFTGSKDILAYRKKTESAKQIDCDLEKGTELRLPDGGAIMHVDDEGPVYLPPEILKKAFGPPKKILEDDEGVAEIKHPDKEYFEEGEQKQLLAELQPGETVFARPHLRAKDLNVQSQRHREQKSEEARKFGEWCEKQSFSDIETMALHLLVTDDGNYLVDEQFWPGRVMCLQNENQTELSKLFKNNLKEDYVRAQLMDAAADIWERYENVC